MTQVHSSQSNSDRSIPRQFTPSSTSAASESSGVLGTLDFDPDVPIPSIEREPDEASTLLTHNNSNLRARTPSFSLTPPATEGIATPVPSISTIYGASPTPGSTIPNLTERIGELGLSGEPASYRASSSGSNPTPGGGWGHSQRSLTTSTDDAIADIVANISLGTETRQPDPPKPGTYLHPRSPSPNLPNSGANSSPGSASRRRSSSYIDPTPHNVADEEPPPERFHEPDFQREFANAKKLVVDLVNVLASSSLHNEAESRIRSLYLQAVDLSRFQNPSTRTVGLVGDSGVGKSSLLNSLLDLDGFARSSNSGAACTCVATEYHYHEDDDFAIEIEYFTMDELESQFIGLLQPYRQYHLHALNDDSVDRDKRDGDEGDGGERRDLEEQAKVAEDTFLAAFRNHLAQNKKFLLDSPEATVLQTLLTWARNSGLPLVERTGTNPEREIFYDASRCSDRLTELTSEPHSLNEFSAWPFIRKIKVSLNAYILSKGLILVDLPGLRDLNSARLKITERYLLNCDEIFATGYIGRATTDAGIMGVFELARRASLSRIGIICTKSDDILPEEAQRDWDGDASTTIRDLIRDIERIQTSLDHNEAQIQYLSVDSDTDGEIDGEESQELLRLHAASRKIKKRIDRRKFELKSYLITTRNQKVTDALRTNYRNRIPGGHLPVFCVSNLEYWEHRTRPKEEALPFLRRSGILEVRKYCLSIVAESQLCAALEYMTDAIPALLGSVQLWVQSGSGDLSAERKQAIRNTLAKIESALDTLKLPASPINTSARSMEQEFNAQISHTMRQYANQWSRAAYNATIEWHGWSHPSYSAFCRHYGDHYTPTVGEHCWNDEAMQAMVTQLASPWQKFQQYLQGVEDNLARVINEGFDRALALSIPTIDPTGSLRTLTITLKHRRALLLSIVEKLEEDFEDNISILRTDAFSGIRSSFIGQLMEPSYEKCRAEGGSGSDKRRKTVIRNSFSSEQLFENHRRRFARKFSELSRDLEDKIQEAIATHIAVVQNDLDTLKNENVALESERHPEFRKQLEKAVRDIRQKMERASSVVSRFRMPAA